MAKTSDWQRYQMLRNIINSALEDIDAEEGDTVTLAISPDLSEVCANVGTTPPFEDGDEDFDGWFIETAYSYEEALSVADKYFDLR